MWTSQSSCYTVLSLSSCQAESTLLPTAQLLPLQSQHGDLVRHHVRLSNILERISPPSCEWLYTIDASHCKQGTLLHEYPLHGLLFPTEKRTTQCSSSEEQSPFWLLKPASMHAHAHLLPWLSWSWTVLLPSDTHREPITSITAILLSLVTYLLTLPLIFLYLELIEYYLLQNSPLA
jgi:hypothetical protein